MKLEDEIKRFDTNEDVINLSSQIINSLPKIKNLLDNPKIYFLSNGDILIKNFCGGPGYISRMHMHIKNCDSMITGQFHFDGIEVYDINIKTKPKFEIKINTVYNYCLPCSLDLIGE